MRNGFVTAMCLGSRGEFGNQLFQIAAVLGHARRFGREAVFRPWICSHVGERNYANYYPDLAYSKTIRPLNLYEQPRFSYDAIPDKPGLDLVGGFQSERFFLPARDQVLELFREPAAITPLVEAFLSQQGVTRFSALQMRFNDRDFVDNNSVMHSLPEHFFVEAARLVPRDRKLFLITNSPTRAHLFANKHLKGTDYTVVSHRNSLIDFYLLTRASFIAISNSSFGWWGAYLNRLVDKVHAPIRRRWFGFPTRLDPKWDTKDLYPDRFVEVPF